MFTRREIVLIVILVLMLGGVGYFLLFFQPIMAEIESLNATIEQREAELIDARVRTFQYGALYVRRYELQDPWEVAMTYIAHEFDVVDILQRVQEIVVPRTQNANVTFAGSSNLGSELVVNTVSISFVSSRAGLEAVLLDLSQDDMYNRIINYSANPVNSSLGQTGELNVNLQVEFLTR